MVIVFLLAPLIAGEDGVAQHASYHPLWPPAVVESSSRKHARSSHHGDLCRDTVAVAVAVDMRINRQGSCVGTERCGELGVVELCSNAGVGQTHWQRTVMTKYSRGQASSRRVSKKMSAAGGALDLRCVPEDMLLKPSARTLAEASQWARLQPARRPTIITDATTIVKGNSRHPAF